MGEELNKFIDENRERTLAYLRDRFKLGEEDLKDVYQDSSIALFNNIKSGQYEEQDADMYTYFLKICINQALKVIDKKKRKRTISLDENVMVGEEEGYRGDKLDELINFIYEVDDYNEQEKMRTNDLVQAIIKELSEKCQELLWGHYGDGLSWDTLVGIYKETYKLANANSAKSTANGCRNKFRALFTEKNARIHG